jgi:ribosome-binding protein aMBF1 (putative translation factor)
MKWFDRDTDELRCEWCRSTISPENAAVVREVGKAITMCEHCAPTNEPAVKAEPQP